MQLLRPIPKSISRPFAGLALIGWAATMGVLVHRSYVQASANLAADLARYGSDAQWQGIYYRGEKIGYTVRQTVPAGSGFELQEDGRLQMSLLGATSFTSIRTTARVDEEFRLQSFEFSMDPGTGATRISGTLQGTLLDLEVTTAGGTRREQRQLDEAPVMAVSIGRRLATAGLQPGAVHRWMVFDPATLQNAPLVARVGERRLVNSEVRRRPVPAFEVQMEFAGLRATSFITDTGEVIREESPLGLITIRETPESARAMAVPARGRTDLLEEAAIVPRSKQRVAEPRDVRRLRMKLAGADLSGFELEGFNQSYAAGILELRDPRQVAPGPADPQTVSYLQPEPFIESDDEQVRAEALRAVEQVSGTRARAERLVRYVNGLLEKKPTVSLPSAREVLRTRVGDCNEHTTLYVAMARALGIPARIAVGLAYTRGAFYYHAWPEVYIDEGRGRGQWLPVDPTFNQFPADAMHVRFVRGSLSEQSRILPLIGKLDIEILELELDPDVPQVLVGRRPADAAPLAIPIPQRSSSSCWDAPAPSDVRELRRR